MQFFKPENYFQVRKILLDHGRRDLIGQGCDCLIPSQPPKEAVDARMKQAELEMYNDQPYHSPSRMVGADSKRRPGQGAGYRPGRRTASRRPRGGPGH